MVRYKSVRFWIVYMRAPNMCNSPDVVIFIAQLAWSLWIWTLTIAKIAAFGLPSFLEHFTNWAWALYGIFFLATLRIGNFGCAEIMAAACFLPVLAVAWFVFIAVAVLLFTNPDFITDLFTTMDPGLVIQGNDLFHVYPIIALLFYAGLNHAIIFTGLRRCLGSVRNDTSLTALLIFYLIAGGALLFAGMYFFILGMVYAKTVNDVYGTNCSVLLGFVVYTGNSVIVSGIPLLMAYQCYGLLPPRREHVEVPAKTVAALDRAWASRINFDIHSE